MNNPTRRQRGSSITRVNLPSGPRWRFRLDLAPGPDGKRRQRTLSFRSEAEAVAAQAKYRTQVREHAYVEPSRLTLAAWLDQWLAVGQRTWRPSTATGYATALRPVREHLGNVTLQRLTRADVERTIMTMLATGGRDGAGRSARTVATALTVLRAALREAVREGVIPRSPAEHVRKPRAADAQLDVWTAQQLRRFLDHVDGDPYVGAWHLAARGLRRGEVLGLRWSDIDTTRGTVTVRASRVQVGGQVHEGQPKTERGRRTLPMDEDLRRALMLTRERTGVEAVTALRRAHSTYVVTGAHGPLSPASFSYMFKRHAADAGLPPIRLHDLRHSSVTAMLQAGVPVVSVAAWHGHDPAVTLRVYGHVQHDALTFAGQALRAALGTR